LPDGSDGWLGPVGLKMGLPPKTDIPGWGLPKHQMIVAAICYFANLPMGLRLELIRNLRPQRNTDAA
jgi:hypothetical protein